MEELQPGQPGNLFGDGQLADRGRSIQQNQFHDALYYRLPLQPNAGAHLLLEAAATEEWRKAYQGWPRRT